MVNLHLDGSLCLFFFEVCCSTISSAMLRNAGDCAFVQPQLECNVIITKCRSYLSGKRGGAPETLDALILRDAGVGEWSV